MLSLQDRAISAGSLVVVTGANGFIASHIADQLLHAGYLVRGTVRNIDKAAWLQQFFDSKFRINKFEMTQVPKMEQLCAFDNAVKGAAGIVHVATPVMQSFDPNEAVPMIIRGSLNALMAAAEGPSVKRVVLTSSSTAAASPQPNKKFRIDEQLCNEEAVRAAWEPPPYEGVQRKLDVYSASKTQAEQEAWKWMKDNRPSFVLNTVLPNCNIGKVLSAENQGSPSTIGWIKALWNSFNGAEDFKANPPQYYINVQDNARVHLAALVYNDVHAERLFTFAHPFNWNDILAVFRKLYPERTFMANIPDLGRDLSTVSNERAEELSKRWGVPGWTGLEQTIQECTAG